MLLAGDTKSFLVRPDRLDPASMFRGIDTGFPSSPLRAISGQKYLFLRGRVSYLREPGKWAG